MDADLIMFIKVALVLFVVIAVVFVIGKIFQSIFFGIVVAVIVSILFTVFFGDGTGLIHYATSFLNDEIGQQIEDGYEFYKEREREKPLLDANKVSEQVSSVFEQAIKEGKETFFLD